MSDEHGSDTDQTKRDTSYSPASDRETAARQEDPDVSEALRDEDIDAADVNVLPGTGGPDDTGDVDLDADDLNLPFSPS
ncbi:MAG: hypothetical protein ABWX59_08820 [Microbacteriaceae bacterium]